VLSVVGTRSGPFFEEGRQLLHQRFARCTDADIPGANHLLHLQAPKLIAVAVIDFIAGAFTK
jgi:pimeloyl-ACP methyl ester carboxylesterase